MKIVDDSPPVLTALDRPNSYIGRSVPRPNLQRLTQGRGQYVSDIMLPRMGHVAFVRSPHAHARIVGIATDAAKKAPGVIAVVTGAELAEVMTPWVGVLTHLKGLKSAPQHAIAVDRACWRGEAVCAVVATTRARAEDAAELVEVTYEELPAVVDPETALDPKTPLIHQSLGDNLCFERRLDAGEVDKAFAEADAVVETTFRTGRHTGVTNEPRSIVADWNEGEQRLTVYQGTQAPHMMQDLFAKHLGLTYAQVRVLTKDVGGSFGIKVHTYADEMAAVALSKLLKRPVKFVADRIESFVTDIHARDHRIKAKIGVKNDGTITAFEIDDLTGIGPYSVYPRTSGIEANQVVNLVGGPYKCPNYRAQTRVVFTNKNVMCQYRAVGHPVAVAVTEGLVELAAAKIGMDPLELRRRNLIPDDAYPTQSASGLKFELLSHHEALAHLDSMMNYAGLRAEQKRLRAQGIYRGIGFASFIEVTNPSAAFYGVGGARITSQDGATVKLDAQGAVVIQSGVTEQGQGTEAVLAQCVASSFGIAIDKVRVIIGDTDNTPYGGGTWASRAAGIGGEAAWQAGKALRDNVLAVAGAMLQAKPGDLDIRNGVVVDKGTGNERLPLEELARVAYFRPDTLPAGVQAELMVTRHYVPRGWPFAFTNGIQASYLEVDIDTGFVKLLDHWCVEDCGTIINPQLVNEQIRGGVVQGIGAALYEQCLYDERGQMLNGNMADYLVPMATEMPDIQCGHVVSPTADSELGAKGAGEAGTAGAPACIMNAINDALRPLAAEPLTDMPFTPDKILQALGKV
ncbi:xanthine dehydrogenase family protein molybdopterin-binding subunit [Pseudolabrys taiwanensis]|uniref:Xanthine dehydrogenase family protein molybdopterin-binding subunit n=1 Tax=Pseudolabrys taiwanensis TaxID=331696 RepID=A0A345ZWP8_9HYPH|nr:xanthine dehydrogenase family protein molybdopterin-binding subunit [Pseudolabrys taiwanensis]AXK81345.1 xanthine dehydrogenase family protein molybdopterin-binding subunit [Pseudolabrys taiwanensis]